MIVKTLLWVSVLVLCTPSAFSQSATTGRIAGTVRDQKGELVVWAEITVRSNTTAAERKVTPDDDAHYNVPLLPPGKYQVRITANGFAPSVFDPVEVVITETTTVNVHLIPAGPDTVSLRVDQLIQQDGPQLGRVVGTRQVSQLPLATRNFTQILALSPGTSVALADNTALGRNSQNISVNGARVTQNDFEINGVDANYIANNAAAFWA